MNLEHVVSYKFDYDKESRSTEESNDLGTGEDMYLCAVNDQ